MEEEEGVEELVQKRLAAMQQAQALEAQKKYLLKHMVDQKAYERLMNVRLANPQLYDQVIGVLISLYKAGRIQGKVSEAQIIQLLAKMSEGKREPTITIKRGK